jgi:hypothetical protein
VMLWAFVSCEFVQLQGSDGTCKLPGLLQHVLGVPEESSSWHAHLTIGQDCCMSGDCHIG